MLRVADYDDCTGLAEERDEDLMCIYCMCAAGPVGYKCGIYMPGKFWRGDRSGYASRKWKCALNVDEVMLYCERTGLEVSRLAVEAADSHACCGANVRPWARGKSMVMEVDHEEKTYAILCEFMPPAGRRDHEKPKAWHNAEQLLSPQALYDSIPYVVPKAYPLVADGIKVPFIGEFPIEQHERSNGCSLDGKGWWLFAKMVTEHDMDNLQHIVEMAHQMLGVRGKGNCGPAGAK